MTAILNKYRWKKRATLLNSCSTIILCPTNPRSKSVSLCPATLAEAAAGACLGVAFIKGAGKRAFFLELGINTEGRSGGGGKRLLGRALSTGASGISGLGGTSSAGGTGGGKKPSMLYAKNIFFPIAPAAASKWFLLKFILSVLCIVSLHNCFPEKSLVSWHMFCQKHPRHFGIS